ncbi:FAD-dependent oxidoreductase [Phormidium sp. CLA17]|uniref:NAD(P)/FAD-dependent oxidoreductase n=1 Tax=Leptolyngbya sp. Cla-17 TaxID=2803751 RepID=UPI0014914909|nr:FAD-dependent oxidoreductase [Leptolyngbya sp. Cla-17]MBM0744205.1 FAD-dependent oxidoreductase [Leptolyngbya sp. Cla-17]
MEAVDIAIVGAGIAGLTCAQQLQQAGYRVAVLEKSRGVGGRLATRRLPDARADHGTCYLSPKGELFGELITHLVEKDVVQVWTDTIHTLNSDRTLQAISDRVPRYVAPDGMSVIAKYLATGLDIRLSQRVIGLELTADQTWSLTMENAQPDAAVPTSTLLARAVLVAIPAPQAVTLLAPLEAAIVSSELIQQLRSVEFDPCIAVMAGYPEDCLKAWQTEYADVKAIAVQHPDLGWIGLDSSKRRTSSQPVFVVQSTAAFANQFLEVADLSAVGQKLLQSAAELLVPWVATPEWMQVHRWRYSFTVSPLSDRYWSAKTTAPLVCAGDWCGGIRVESALSSGQAAAEYLNQQMGDRPSATPRFWQAI